VRQQEAKNGRAGGAVVRGGPLGRAAALHVVRCRLVAPFKLAGHGRCGTISGRILGSRMSI